MSLSDFASIGSLVSGGAVLVSLVYLSLQIRQTERNQRASVNQRIIDRQFDVSLRLSEPPLAGLHLRAFTNQEDYTDAEILQLMNVAAAVATGAMDAWVQHKANLIDELAFNSALRPAATMFCQPVYRSIWPMARAVFPREFRDFFEDHINRIPLREQVNLGVQFRANMKGLEPSRPVLVVEQSCLILTSALDDPWAAAFDPKPSSPTLCSVSKPARPVPRSAPCPSPPRRLGQGASAGSPFRRRDLTYGHFSL